MKFNIITVTPDCAATRLDVLWSDAFDGPASGVLALRDYPHNMVKGWAHSPEIGARELQRVGFVERETWGILVDEETAQKLLGRDQ